MPNFSIENQNKTIAVIDKTIKKAVDHIANVITAKMGYHLSEATQGEIVNLTTEYIKRLNSIIASENLLEPEVFDSTYWDMR